MSSDGLAYAPYCRDCGARLDQSFVAEIRAKRVARGLDDRPPVMCARCVWERICNMADANAPAAAEPEDYE